MLTAVILLSGGCSKEETSYNNTSYTLIKKDLLGVSGTVTFTETSNNSTIIDVALVNAPAGSNHVYLYMQSVVEKGEVAETLNPIEATGKSSTVVKMPYSQLIAYEGFIRVLKSSSENNLIIAQGDIGGNVITSINKSYTLSTISPYGVSGTALFEKRANGNTLLTVSLNGAIAGVEYPATINLGSIESVDGGPVKKVLNNIIGATESYTNIRTLESGSPITYENWLVYLGYINIYQRSVLSDNIISHGNIGKN